MYVNLVGPIFPLDSVINNLMKGLNFLLFKILTLWHKQQSPVLYMYTVAERDPGDGATDEGASAALPTAGPQRQNSG